MDELLVLGIETSGVLCSLAWYRDEKVLLQYDIEIPNAHARLVGQLVDEGFRKIKMRANETGLITVSRGPGSFTGLRIGMSFAKGFSFAKNTPIVAVSNFEILASQAPENSFPLHILIDARRGNVYHAVFRKSSTEFEDAAILSLVDFSSAFDGKGLVLAHEDLRQNDNLQSLPGVQTFRYGAVHLCRCGLNRYLSNGADKPEELEPLYLQEFAGVS